MHSLYKLLEKLDAGKWSYALSRHRRDSILVSVSFVGERVEIDVFDDGHMEVSRFIGREDVLGGKKYIFDLIAEFAKTDQPNQSSKPTLAGRQSG